MNKYTLATLAFLAAAPAMAATIEYTDTNGTIDLTPTSGTAAASSASQDIEVADEFGVFNATVKAAEEGPVTFTVTALEDLLIINNSLSGNGLPEDLDNFTISLVNDYGYTETTTFDIVTFGGSSYGGSFFEDFSLLAGQTATVTFDFETVGSAVPISWRFDVAAVPVPAALPLLLAGIGALGVVRSRKKA